MFSRNSPIQILHRLTSVYTLLAVLTTYSLPAFAQSISASDMLARWDSPDASMPAPRKFDPATLLRQDKGGFLEGRVAGEALADEISNDDFDDLLFDQSDHWHGGVAPAAWSTPEDETSSGQFFQVLDICLNNLPEKPARVFTMKEFMECDAEEICSVINITKSDYWQSMSRARKQIHLCLNQRWFDGETLP